MRQAVVPVDLEVVLSSLVQFEGEQRLSSCPAQAVHPVRSNFA